MSAQWITEIMSIQSLNLDGIDVVSTLVSIASKAEMVQGLTEGSIPIIMPQGSTEATYNSLVGLYSCGTKYWDGFIYMVLSKHPNRATRDRFSKVFVVSFGEPRPYDPVSATKTAISQVILWVTRGGLSNTSSQAPLPKMIRNINLFKEGEMTTEGEYMSSVMSFDPKLINLKALFNQNASSLGFDQVFMQRMKLSIAGHKPLKVINDNWSMISPNLLSGGGTTVNDKMSELVSVLRSKSVAGMTYSRLHPGHEQNVAQKYNGFYKTCLHAIVSVMSGFDNTRVENSLTIICSRGLFNSDPFMRTIRGQPAGIINYQTTVESWNLTQLETDIGDLWLSE